MRSIHVSVLVCVAALGLLPSPAAAQGAFGIGARIAMVRDDAHVDADAVRFTGGQLRLGMSRRATLEVSMDFKTLEIPGGTIRTKDRPLQLSLLVYPTKRTLAPYLLGGVGWYKREVQLMNGDSVVSSESTVEFGYHGGFGLQVGLGKHAALHADYRYTGLHFGDDDTAAASNLSDRSSLLGVPSGILPGYKGSMWTAGFTVYF